jgi:hypothetical protein
MEELSVSVVAVVVHFLMTCIPWLVGTVIGGGLGALCGLGIRALFSAKPALRRPLVLLPCRTFGVGLLMVLCSPLFVTILGIGPLAGGVMVAGSICVLVMAFAATTLLEYWHPSPLGARFIGGARTLAVASGLIAAGVGLLGGGGFGFIIREAARLSQYGVMWKGLLVVLALALVLDLTLGIAQMMAFQQSRDISESTTTQGLTA